MSLSELHLPSLLEVLKVPADEGVVVRVGVRGDERPTPVNLRTETFLLENNMCKIFSVKNTTMELLAQKMK